MVLDFKKNGIAIKEEVVCSRCEFGRNKENENSGLRDFQLEKTICLSRHGAKQAAGYRNLECESLDWSSELLAHRK